MKTPSLLKLCLLLPLMGIAGCPSRSPSDLPVANATPTPKPQPQSKESAESAPAKPDPSNGTTAAQVPQGTNHIEGFDRDLLQFTDQGSGFFPMSIVRALNDWKTGRPYLENLERFGLVPGEKSDRNPEGFPVGIVTNTIKSDGRDIVMFGFNCAACHTSDFRYQGQTIRVDGGSGLFYVDQLGDQIGLSLKATLENPDEFLAFLLRFARHANLAKDHVARLEKLAALERESSLGKALRARLEARGQELLADLKNAKGIANNSGHAGTPPESLLTSFKKNPEVARLLNSIGQDLEMTPLDKMYSEIANVIADLRYRLDFLKTRDWLSSDPEHRLAAGYGRADDFGTARVELFGGWNKKNLLAVNAPVSVPPLWNVDKFAWLHWNANTNSVIQRSIGEALGVGATFNSETGETSVAVANQMKIEEQVQKLTPPAWPAQLFGTPDPEMAERGKKLFGEHCAGCHVPTKLDDKGLVIFNLSTLNDVGADPNDARNFDVPVYRADDSTVGFAESIASLLNVLQDKAKAAMSAEDKALMDRLEAKQSPAKWRDTLKTTGGPVYPARPLEGIWATAPYLHNGSVPTLYHLLFPEERPAKFLVGQKDYDPVKVGFEIDTAKITPQPDLDLFEFDTSVAGNANTGHSGKEYGTELSRDDRLAIIEYLKVHHDTWPVKAAAAALP
jgi:mono/diheme cytochrome c family protein